MSRAAKRHKRRMFCEIVHDGRGQNAIVLDVSRSGLFVQTAARLTPGTEIELDVRLDASAEPIRLRAAVARQKAVPAQLTGVAHGGVGLRILEAPRAYYDAIGEQPPWPIAKKRSAPEPAPVSAPAPALEPRFRVRVKQSDGPRSRVLHIVAETAERACALALKEVGAGWEALGAERA